MTSPSGISGSLEDSICVLSRETPSLISSTSSIMDKSGVELQFGMDCSGGGGGDSALEIQESIENEDQELIIVEEEPNGFMLVSTLDEVNGSGDMGSRDFERLMESSPSLRQSLSGEDFEILEESKMSRISLPPLQFPPSEALWTPENSPIRFDINNDSSPIPISSLLKDLNASPREMEDLEISKTDSEILYDCGAPFEFIVEGFDSIISKSTEAFQF